VLKKLLSQPNTQASERHNAAPLTGLNLSLLQSDPPDGTELRQANALFLTEVQKARDLPSPVKRYAARITQAFEATFTKNTTLRNETTRQQKLLQSRKKRTTGKRVVLKGKFVFSTQEVLEVARKAEEATADKPSRKQRRMQPEAIEIESQVVKPLKNISSDSDLDCIIVEQRK
jgi:hypothetical protein